MDEAVVESTVGTLMELMLSNCGVVILRNPHGVMELRGDDLYLRRGRTLTIYHSSPKRGESQSHAHIYVEGLRWAKVIEGDGVTPRLAFWSEKSNENEKAPFTITFPRFYDWEQRQPIPENIEYFKNWVQKNGRVFSLLPDKPMDRSLRAAAGFPGSKNIGSTPQKSSEPRES